MNTKAPHIPGKKHCYLCNEYKEKYWFYKNKSNTDGLDTRCIPCCKKHSKERRLHDPQYFKNKYKNFIKQHPGYSTMKVKEWLERQKTSPGQTQFL